MAFARPLQVSDENARDKTAVAAVGKAGQQPLNQRRALGDIGNLVGPFNTRCNVGKENATKKPVLTEKAAQILSQPGVLTRGQAAKAGVVLDAQAWSGHLKPVQGTYSVPKQKQGLQAKEDSSAAPAASKAVVERHAAARAPSGKSLTALLQSRSEAMVPLSERELAQEAPAVPDIDAKDHGDPLAASVYVRDIFSFYKRIEGTFRPSPDYMSRQTDINENMRAILIDWLVEVHYKFKLMPETLFLTANLIDRFLEKKRVSRRNLQLVGVTAMLVASKYEEIWAPEVKDFVFISDEAYTREQILEMEKIMLNTLRFNLTVPTAFAFLHRYLKAGIIPRHPQMAQAQAYATYLVELAMLDYSMLGHTYSMVAAAAVVCANRLLGREEDCPPALQKHCGYTRDQLLPCAHELAHLHAKAAGAALRTVYKKYSHTAHSKVSLLRPPRSLLEA